MPSRLTDAHIRRIKTPEESFKLTDGNGLYLLVHSNGSRYWRYRFRMEGKETVFAIGQYPEISLQSAREKRDAARRVVKAGKNPAHERKLSVASDARSAAITFELIAGEWIGKNEAHWSASYTRQVRAILKSDVFPTIGNKAIESVTSHQVLTIIKDVAGREATAVATLIRQWCSAIFRYGISTLRCATDPASALKGAIKRPKVKHKQALQSTDLKRLVKQITRQPRSPVSFALRLLVLTFVRPGELRSAEWREIDWEAKEWRIPAARMKMREEHIVPLSSQAMEILEEMQRLRLPMRSLLFPNKNDPRKPMSPTTLNRALERMGWTGKFSAHGFRATASTHLNESGYRPDVIERQLAHKERNKVRASYNHASYMSERREMMQKWAEYVASMTD